METLVMDGLKMIDGTEGTYMYEIIGSQMASPYLQLEHDEYGIGYTPFFYCTAMVRDLMRVDMLSIDGVMPSKESLRANASARRKTTKAWRISSISFCSPRRVRI